MVYRILLPVFAVLFVFNINFVYGNSLGTTDTKVVTSCSEIHQYGYEYISPWPESEYLPPQSFILVRFSSASPYDLTNLSSFISVHGEQSGSHNGNIKIASDSNTVIFKPKNDFSKNEIVQVTLSPLFKASVQDTVQSIQYEFYISNSKAKLTSGALLKQTPVMPNLAIENGKNESQVINHPNVITTISGDAEIMGNGVSVPSDFPRVDVMVNDNPDSGYIFIDYDSDVRYGMILNNEGEPVWYKRGSTYRDFTVQKNGMMSYVGSGFTVVDQNFQKVRNCQAANGYGTDDHELQLLEDGGYLLIGSRTETVDMTQYVANGQEYATVYETVIQEFTSEGDLIFQWRAWDNYDILGLENWSYDDKPTSNSIRFPHMNSIDIDTDGNIILSAKRISEITKINRKTGEIIWRLGGDYNEFTINDPLEQFNVQHDVRVVGENRYTVFDNHYRDRTASSRVVEYEIDPVAKIADLVWVYEENPRYESHHMGSAQRLPNGNTFINWVETNLPKATEVRPDGSKAYEMNWADRNSKSYRVFRFPWNGVVEKPYLVVESTPDDVTLIFNKFGDLNVDFYRIYGGKTSGPTTILATSQTTLKKLTNLENNTTYFFRVTAVDKSGQESSFSNEESVFVKFISPDENMVLNADFSDGKENWVLENAVDTDVEWTIENEISHLNIVNGGSLLTSIFLYQDGMPLIQGKQYVLQFDAHGASARVLEVKVEQSTSPYTNYSKNGQTALSRNDKQFVYEFKMQNVTDYNARLAIYAGGSNSDVYIDNLVLKEIQTNANDTVTIQAEDAIFGGGASIDNDHEDFFGQGFINFPASDGYVEFLNINGGNGGEFLIAYRYALGSAPRTGVLKINDQIQTITMQGTDDWAYWRTDSISATLDSGTGNTIRFESSGEDFGNLDQITVIPQNPTKAEWMGNIVTIPVSYQLWQNYPNPFNPVTNIKYQLPKDAHVTVKIFNSLGQKIATLVDEEKKAGYYTLTWDASNNATGLYFVTMKTKDYVENHKMLLIR